ncbi:MAG: hypothetical protein GY822_12020 [Deltaproteobacteria bacterium]|nr:hypothetical protein [Deltaproteobacteria bacterium]
MPQHCTLASSKTVQECVLPTSNCAAVQIPKMGEGLKLADTMLIPNC